MLRAIVACFDMKTLPKKGNQRQQITDLPKYGWISSRLPDNTARF